MLVDLSELRPNNWYINRRKLESVRKVWSSGLQDELPPVLITEIDGELALIDGHSRAYAAYENGSARISAEYRDLEEIEGDAGLYRHIHRMGPGRGVLTIVDLSDRIVSPQEHQRLWIGYCQRWLKEHRGG